MRLNLPLFILLLLSCTADAQKLTGIWRGYFVSSGGIYTGNTHEETYKYEIQIEQQSNSGVVGVTYSYKSTVFYAKADLQGIFTGSSKSLIIKETKMVDLKIGYQSDPCLMTCYLDYIKMGKLEVLEGTFISTNIKNKSDCGSGKVYLERVATSDFKKEDFFLKKKDDTDKTTGKPFTTPRSARDAAESLLNKNKNHSVILPPVTKTAPLKPSGSQQRSTNLPPTIKKPGSKPIAKNKPPVKKEDKTVVIVRPSERVQEEPVNSKKQPEASLPQPEAQLQTIPIPKVLAERENKLAKVITTSEEDVQIDFYDNGEIDNDTISVYHNNKLIISHGRLSNNPITIKIKCSKTDNRHELVVVAENLGDIPPNTALMVIRFGRELLGRKEIFLASDEQRNAKVVINYVPKE